MVAYKTLVSAMRICGDLWVLVGVVWLAFALRRKPTQQRESLVSRLKYSIPTILAFFLLFSRDIPFDWLYIKTMPDLLAIRIIGVALTAIGIGFAIWARVYIGENWSGIVTVKVGHELVRTGPYTWVRHPIYSGLLLAAVGTGLVGGEPRGLIAVIVLWLGLWMKSRVEEEFMLKTFGSAYTEYSRSTGALIPRFHH